MVRLRKWFTINPLTQQQFELYVCCTLFSRAYSSGKERKKQKQQTQDNNTIVFTENKQLIPSTGTEEITKYQK